MGTGKNAYQLKFEASSSNERNNWLKHLSKIHTSLKDGDRRSKSLDQPLEKRKGFLKKVVGGLSRKKTINHKSTKLEEEVQEGEPQ